MIDSHCHLTYQPLAENLDAVLARAAAAGVQQAICIGTRLADSTAGRDLARRYPNIFATAGIHPHHAAEIAAGELEGVCDLLGDPGIVAAGELGLDYHYEFAPRAAQVPVFERLLDAAVQAGKPLVLHCREAIDDSLAILKTRPFLDGVFHCFTGTLEEARRVLDAGYCLGFTGIVTFKNADYLREIAKFVPADRMLVETDAPYLAPEPFRRQKVNEPALVVHVAARIAAVRGVTAAMVEEQTTQNVRRLFRLEK
jgi:TatD DNase family protein